MWVTENDVSNREGSGKSANNIYSTVDRAVQSSVLWLTEFSLTYMFWFCVTLGLSHSVCKDEKFMIKDKRSQ
jgi:hypothetical protein